MDVFALRLAEEGQRRSSCAGYLFLVSGVRVYSSVYNVPAVYFIRLVRRLFLRNTIPNEHHRARRLLGKEYSGRLYRLAAAELRIDHVSQRCGDVKTGSGWVRVYDFCATSASRA